MEKVTLKNEKIIAAFNATSALQMWLRPGLLAYLVGDIVEALRAPAMRLSTERARMLDEAAQKDEHGQNVTRTENGQQITLFSSKEAGEEFVARVKELFDAESTIEIERRLTLADVERIERERLSAPRAAGDSSAAADTSFSVDFAALLPLIDRSPPAPAAAAKAPAP